jgi:KDO2-lipid IV(A) lauroyltransferase
MARTDPGPGNEEDPAPSLRHRLEFALVRAACVALLSTDLRGASRIGRVLGRVLGTLDLRHRRTAEDNIRRAYAGALPEGEARRLALRVYERLGVTAAEVLHGPRRIRGKAARRWFSYEGCEELRSTLGGKPVVLLGAHFGNWEHLVPAARLAGFDLVSVARPLDNPLLDRWVTGMREGLGNFAIPKKGALRGLLRAVRDGKSVGMLVDQNGGRHGKLASFFGRPCSTQAAGVSLARRLGIPFSVCSLERRAPGFHRFVVGTPVYVRDDDAGEQEAVEEMNRQLEVRVRRRPEDWMWLHRRWRIRADWGFPVEPTEGKRKA